MTEARRIDTKLIGFTTVAALLGMGFAAAMSASADMTTVGWGSQRGTCDPERHEQVEAALEAGDYEAWAELMDGRGRISNVVNEGNFDTFVELHEATEAGDAETAQTLREELGLGIRPQDGSGYRGGMGHGKSGMHRATGSGPRWDNK